MRHTNCDVCFSNWQCDVSQNGAGVRCGEEISVLHCHAGVVNVETATVGCVCGIVYIPDVELQFAAVSGIDCDFARSSRACDETRCA